MGSKELLLFLFSSFVWLCSPYRPTSDKSGTCSSLMHLGCFLESFKAKTYTRQNFLKMQSSFYKLGGLHITPFPSPLLLAEKLHILVSRSASVEWIQEPMYWLFTEGCC